MYEFLVVGAQKCGTTSLHRYLEGVPQISLPLNKEEPIFDSSKLDEKALIEHFREIFGEKEKSKIYGKCSPQYMTSISIPERIKRLNGNTKIIVLIRDPIERAYSQYKMEVRRGAEVRSFESAMVEALKEHDPHRYLDTGEYCKYVSEYRKVFSDENVLLSSLERLNRDSMAEFIKIIKFIGCDDSVIPSNVGKVYHKGGVERKTDIVDRIKKNTALKTVVKKIIPDYLIRAFNYWFEQWNVVPDRGDGANLPEALVDRLKLHYCQEFELLRMVNDE